MDLILQTVLNSPGSIAFDSASRIRTDQTSLLLFAAGEVTLTYHNAHILSSATLRALGFNRFSTNRREMSPYPPDSRPTGVKLFIHSDVNISITQELPVVNTFSIISFHFSIIISSISSATFIPPNSTFHHFIPCFHLFRHFPPLQRKILPRGCPEEKV